MEPVGILAVALVEPESLLDPPQSQSSRPRCHPECRPLLGPPTRQGQGQHQVVMVTLTPCLVGVVCGIQVHLDLEVLELLYQFGHEAHAPGDLQALALKGCYGTAHEVSLRDVVGASPTGLGDAARYGDG